MISDECFFELREVHDIMLRIARRCARDLRHAIDNIPADNPYRDMMVERQQFFATALADLSEYRLKLHLQIDQLTRENENLRLVATKLQEQEQTLTEELRMFREQREKGGLF